MWDELPGICVKFAWALFLAGLLGLERERKGRAAGLRTHILVCLGATLAMVVADIVARQWADSGGPVWLDQGRIAAGILTGVGFLGAGAIINEGNIHRGLTTAAMIWFTAALGIAIGLGLYLIAACATVFALAVVVGLRYLTFRLPSAEAFSLQLQFHGSLGLVEEVEKALEEQRYRVNASRLRSSQEDGSVDVTFELVSRGRLPIETFTDTLQHRFPAIERIILER